MILYLTNIGFIDFAVEHIEMTKKHNEIYTIVLIHPNQLKIYD